MIKNFFGDDPEKLRELSKRIKKSILQEMGKRGLNITEEHFDVIMRTQGIGGFEVMMNIRMYVIILLDLIKVSMTEYLNVLIREKMVNLMLEMILVGISSHVIIQIGIKNILE